MSDEENDESEPKTLETINYSNRKERLKSPHSKLALAQLGIREEKLYEITKEKYLQIHPELNGASSDIQDKRYEHYNKRREEKGIKILKNEANIRKVNKIEEIKLKNLIKELTSENERRKD